MSPWENILNVLGWFLLVLVVLIAVVVISAILIGTIGGIRKWFPNKRTTPYPDNLPTPDSHQDDYMAEATVVGKSMYDHEIIMQAELLEAFRAGARWGWGFFHRP